MPHQKKAYNKFAPLNYLALFMEMRLGKSLVAIRWASKFKGPKLIIAPITPLGDWERELILENKKDILSLCISKQKLRGIEHTINNQWCLINYEKLRANPWLLYDIDWGVIIADESTKIRKPGNEITKILCKRDYCLNRAILSGLPRPETDLDFFQQFKFLHGEFLNIDNFWNFRRKYFHQGWSGFNWVANTGTKTKIKREVHGKAFILTRKQAGIGSKKIYQRHDIEMDAAQKKIYKMIKKEFAFDLKNKDKWTKWAPTKFLWMSRVAGGFTPDTKQLLSDKKAKVILDLLTENLKGQKVVIWFRFNKEMDYIKQVLKNNHILFRSISAATKGIDRKSKTNTFRSSKKMNVMLSQIKCSKYGVDWSCADTAIYYSNPYDMEDRAQSEDRIIHPKKKIPVLFIDLITKETIDEDVLSILQGKKIDSNYFLKQLMNFTERKK